MIRSMSPRSRTSLASSVAASSSSLPRWESMIAVATSNASSASARTSSSRTRRVASDALVDRRADSELEPRPHRVLVDHRVRDLGDPLEVVRGAGGDRAEHELLGRPAAEQHRHEVDQLLAGLQVAILLGQVQRVPQRAPVRDDRDPVHAIYRREQLAAQGMARPRGRRRRASRGRSTSGATACPRRRARAPGRSPSSRPLRPRGGRRRSRPRYRYSPGRRRSAPRSGGRAAAGRLSRRAACCGSGRRGSARGRRRRAARRRSGGQSGRVAAAPGRACRAGWRRRSRPRHCGR